MLPFILLSSQAVMLFALLSAISRAGLNIVDRYQIGLRGLSIRRVNLWNNVIPALLMVMLCLLFGLGHELWNFILSWKTILFSALVQLVAYSFSYAFRHLNVNQVTVIAKLADFFIPIGLFFTTAHWSWSSYSFAAITTVVCLPMFWKTGKTQGSIFSNIATGCFVIGTLIAQASLAPLLIDAPPMGLTSNIRHAFLFTVTVLFWRSAWSILPLLFQRQSTQERTWIYFLINPIFLLRILLTIITQISFILAIGSSKSLVAWPILNSTGIFALFLSKQFLKDHHGRLEQVIIVVIALLELTRFISL